MAYLKSRQPSANIIAAVVSKHRAGNLLLSSICFMLYQRQLMNGVVNNAKCVGGVCGVLDEWVFSDDCVFTSVFGWFVCANEERGGWGGEVGE